MGLESATYISGLNAANPVGAVDPKAQGDDHIRLIKSTLQASFPNIAGAMTVSHTALNALAAIGLTGFAVPTVAVGPAGAAAGAATTALRSDAKLVIDLTANYTWTGNVTFNGVSPGVTINTAALGQAALRFQSNSVTKGYVTLSGAWEGDSTTDMAIVAEGTGGIRFYTSGSATERVTIGQQGDVSIANLFSGINPALTINRATGQINTAWTDGTVSVKYYSSGGSTVANFGATSDHAFSLLQNDTARLTFAAAGANATFSIPVRIAVASDAIRLIGDATYLSIYNTANTTRTGYLQGDTTTGVFLASDLAGKHVTLTSNAGLVRLSEDNGSTVYKVGFRSLPLSTTATTLAIGDVGKCVDITAAINIPASVFAAGDIVSIYNNSAGALNITISAGTLRLAGTNTTGTRSLPQRKTCTLWFRVGGATPEVICEGAN